MSLEQQYEQQLYNIVNNDRELKNHEKDGFRNFTYKLVAFISLRVNYIPMRYQVISL